MSSENHNHLHHKPVVRRRTKIVATLGPASSSAEVIGEMIDNGVNIFRLNFSHGDHAAHTTNVKTIRELAEVKKRHVGILGDLQGPKIRLGNLQEESKPLSLEQELVLTTDEATADSRNDRIHVSYEPLPVSVSNGDTLLLDDGRIRLQVTSVAGNDVHCKVIQPSTLSSRKGINKLGGGLAADAITPKDMIDLQCIIDNALEYVAVSFPCKGSDLDPVKEALYKSGSSAKIIAKIERAEIVATDEALKEIIDAADGVMVARGDLGVEIGDPQLVGVQKKIIHFARLANKPVITATQMMESMITEPVPTRAEVFDVANAVLDGTDAVMLSGETAMGKLPSAVVRAMSETALGAEQHPLVRKSDYRISQTFEKIDECIAISTMYAANHITGIEAIVCLTESGTSPLIASRISSSLPIYGMSRHLSTCRRMALYRGVVPIHFDVTKVGDDPWIEALKCLGERGDLGPGQRVAVTCGDFAGQGGSTNTLKILEYNP